MIDCLFYIDCEDDLTDSGFDRCFLELEENNRAEAEERESSVSSS